MVAALQAIKAKASTSTTAIDLRFIFLLTIWPHRLIAGRGACFYRDGTAGICYCRLDLREKLVKLGYRVKDFLGHYIPRSAHKDTASRILNKVAPVDFNL
jgi:hypothetical protein